MSNSYGVHLIPEDAQYGLIDTINGEWVGFWWESRGKAEEWVQTQNDKDAETGEDWTEGEIMAVVSITDDTDYVV